MMKTAPGCDSSLRDDGDRASGIALARACTPVAHAPLLTRGLELERSELLLLRSEFDRIDLPGGDTASWNRRSNATTAGSPGDGRVRGCLSDTAATASCSPATANTSCKG